MSGAEENSFSNLKVNILLVNKHPLEGEPVLLSGTIN